jgi:uracil-DNA glycosylase
VNAADLHAQRKDGGKCTRCGRAPREGAFQCDTCLNYYAQKQAEYRATLPYAVKELVRAQTKIAVALGAVTLPEVCEDCGAAENLQVHHRTYTGAGFLMVTQLCPKCHRAADRRDRTRGTDPWEGLNAADVLGLVLRGAP